MCSSRLLPSVSLMAYWNWIHYLTDPETIIDTHPALSHLSHLLSASGSLPAPLPHNLSDSPHLTVFAPSNEAFHGVFDDVEKGYLEGQFGAEGVARVIGGGIIIGSDKDGVGWSDHYGKNERSGG